MHCNNQLVETCKKCLKYCNTDKLDVKLFEALIHLFSKY